MNMRLVDLGPFLPTLLVLVNGTLWLQHVCNTLLLAKIYNFWQVCSFVGLSVCLSVC